jgi:glyoxylase I family protein
MFTPHHFTLSVSNIDKSITYYETFGFKLMHVWRAEDGSLAIVHLDLNGFILELFGFTHNAGVVQSEPEMGNDLGRVGVKHLALQVASLADAKGALQDAGLDPGTEITKGRTGIEYFFIQDPDGLWLEIVEDHRKREVDL